MADLWIFLIFVALSAPVIVTSRHLPSIQERKKRHVFYRGISELINRIHEMEDEIKARKTEVGMWQLTSCRCESGTSELYPNNKPAKPIDGQKARGHSVHVTFSRPFSTRPFVSVSLSNLHAYKYKNLTVHPKASGVTVSGFDVGVDEWSDTRLATIVVFWIACRNVTKDRSEVDEEYDRLLPRC